MANKILLDTSILIDLQKGVDETIDQFSDIQHIACISRITACEFIYGARDKIEKKINKNFLNKLEILEVSEDISKFTYLILDKYALETKTGILDAIIASTSMTYKIPLWTLNRKHFKYIRDLELYGRGCRT